MSLHIAFLGTSKSGLGHLRRLCNIAGQLRLARDDIAITLMTNAAPDGLTQDDLAAFSDVVLAPRDEMAQQLAGRACDVAVLDTLKLPGIAAFGGKSALILRETPCEQIADFRREDGRAWDLVLVPNPADHWLPDVPTGFAHSVEAVGWILRATGIRQADAPSQGIVVATGGGGSQQTRAQLYPVLEAVIAKARRLCRQDVTFRQALGPRAAGAALSHVDEVFDPGGALNGVFRDADLVISTAGYNSVLELASTDTPTLLAPIPRSFDDQFARVRLWGPRLGFGLDPTRIDEAADWLAGQINTPRRRAPVDLGPDGARRAARSLLDLICRAS